MPLHIIRGDILDVDADAIVISASPNISEGGKLGKLVYEAAGWEEMMAEREKIGRMRPGNAAITSGYQLEAKYVIHTVVPIWNGGESEEALRRCYRSSLKLAKEAGLQSVAFVLLGSGLCYVPYNKAFEIANETIGTWLEGQESELQVYLVIKPDNKELSDGDKEYDSQNFSCYMNKYIGTKSQFASKISCSPSTITRLMNREYKTPRKELILSVMLGMIEIGFPLEQRFELVNVGGYSYPVDSRDRCIEALLKSGERKCSVINTKLMEIDVNWDLSRLCKDDTEAKKLTKKSKKSKKSKKTKNTKQKEKA